MPKFVCATKTLKEALSVASRNLARNTPKDVYKGLYFQTTQDAVTLTATDGICKTTITIPADVQSEGTAIVVAEKFIQFIGKLDDEKVTIEADNTAARIVYNGNHARIPVIAGTFPEYEKEPDVVPVKFKADDITEALEKTIFCCAGEATQYPILRGVLFEVGSESINIVALDGQRGACVHLTDINELPGAVELPMKKVVSSKSASDLLKIIQDADVEDVVIGFGEKRLYMTLKDISYESVLLIGEYVDYRRLFQPEKVKPVIYVNGTEFKNAVERAMLFSESGALRLEINDGLIIRQNSQNGDINERVLAMEPPADNIVFGLNPKYLLDVLKRLTSETVVIRKNPEVDISAIYVEDGTATNLIMPVRLNN